MGRNRARHARKKSARHGALVAAAAATASTMAVTPITPAPEADADIIDIITTACDAVGCDFWTAGILTGPLFTLVSAIYSSPLGPLLPPGEISTPFGDFDVNALIPPLLNLFTNAFPLPGDTPGYPETIANANLAAQDDVLPRIHVNVGIMDGALAIGQSIYPFQDGIGFAVLPNPYIFALIRNPGRANGGIATRFDGLYSLIFGRTAVSGDVATGLGYIPVKADVGIGYDAFSDFPNWPNPFAIANSIAESFLLTNALGDIEIKTNFTGVFELNVYVTVVPEDNALLEPLRLTSRLLDEIAEYVPYIPYVSELSANLVTIADAYEPAFDTVINIGYDDVDLTTYERSFDQFDLDDQKQFSFLPTLTIDQIVTAGGVALQQFIQATIDLIEPLLFGIPLGEILGLPDEFPEPRDEEQSNAVAAAPPTLTPEEAEAVRATASLFPQMIANSILEAAGLSADNTAVAAATAEEVTPAPGVSADEEGDAQDYAGVDQLGPGSKARDDETGRLGTRSGDETGRLGTRSGDETSARRPQADAVTAGPSNQADKNRSRNAANNEADSATDAGTPDNDADGSGNDADGSGNDDGSSGNNPGNAGTDGSAARSSAGSAAA